MFEHMSQCAITVGDIRAIIREELKVMREEYLYRCKCSCGSYETLFDMYLGTALNAAHMHAMLGDGHIVTISQPGPVAIYEATSDGLKLLPKTANVCST